MSVVRFEDVNLAVSSDPGHDWLLSNADVAAGFGVPVETVRSAKSRHAAELHLGKHWVVADCNTPGGQQHLTVWTKRGVIRLGFLLTSERARRFRDFAEDLVLGHLQAAPEVQLTPLEVGRRWVAALEANEALRAENAVLAPKAELHDALMGADGDMSVREAAQALVRAGVETGQGRLFNTLVDLNWLDKTKQPLQRHVDRGVLVRKITTYADTLGDVHSSTQVRVTPKGVAELVRRLAGPALAVVPAN